MKRFPVTFRTFCSGAPRSRVSTATCSDWPCVENAQRSTSRANSDSVFVLQFEKRLVERFFEYSLVGLFQTASTSPGPAGWCQELWAPRTENHFMFLKGYYSPIAPGECTP